MAARILYVEDNAQNMRLVRKILTATGYTVLEAVNGVTGMAMAAAEQPDLILMDVNLPDISGLDATGRLKADPATKHIPVVALTANAMHGDRENCLAAGCDGYLAKPVMKAELLSAVETYAKARKEVVPPAEASVVPSVPVPSVN
jgi:two-component system, cell cycle response regulator DivK